jgi:hypothetical protein
VVRIQDLRDGRIRVRWRREIQAFGETTKVFNGGDRSKVIASFGVGLKR